jgi:hypothetical protein
MIPLISRIDSHLQVLSRYRIKQSIKLGHTSRLGIHLPPYATKGTQRKSILPCKFSHEQLITRYLLDIFLSLKYLAAVNQLGPSQLTFVIPQHIPTPKPFPQSTKCRHPSLNAHVKMTACTLGASTRLTRTDMAHCPNDVTTRVLPLSPNPIE